jgi:hypothetical protein
MDHTEREGLMEFDMIVNKSDGYCDVHVTGTVNRTDFETQMLKILEHPDLVSGMPIIYDLHNADVKHLNEKDFRQLQIVNRHLAPRRGKALVAIVVPDDLEFGLARMYAVMGASPNLKINVFRNHSSALEWVLQSAGHSADDRFSGGPHQ